MADQVEIGSVFAGHRIDAVAGRGGMGVVYVATHLALNRRVALKLIAPDGCRRATRTRSSAARSNARTARPKGRVPKEFTSASDASSSTTINGRRATVITVDGTTFQMVKGRSFWEIDGVG